MKIAGEDFLYSNYSYIPRQIGKIRESFMVARLSNRTKDLKERHVWETLSFSVTKAKISPKTK